VDISHALWITSADCIASPTSADLGYQHSKYSGRQIEAL